MCRNCSTEGQMSRSSNIQWELMTKENCTETDGMSPNNFLLLDSEINELPEATEETKVVFGSCDYKGVWSCQRPLLWKERGTHYMSYKMANYWNPSPSNYKQYIKDQQRLYCCPQSQLRCRGTLIGIQLKNNSIFCVLETLLRNLHASSHQTLAFAKEAADASKVTWTKSHRQ